MSQYLTGTSGQMQALLKSANTKIFRALLSIASAALLIRVMGLFNQVIVTAHFGEGAAMDAYFVASSLPIVLAQLIDGAIVASVIPVYSRVRTQGGREEASKLFSTLLNLIIIGAVLLTVGMLFFRHQLVLISAPALDSFRTELAYNLTLFIFPALLLMTIVNFMDSILNAEGQFSWPAYAGLLVPATTAILVIAFGRFQGIIVLCIGTLTGLCLQLCFIMVRAKQAKIVYWPILDLRSREIVTVLSASWPILLGAIMSQASPLVDQIFASYLSTGNIAALSYALKLISVPTGVIFVSLGRAVLPYLSLQASIEDMKAFKGTLRLYLWYLGTGTTILSILMLLLAHPLVQILFQHGAFTASDTDRTTSILLGFAIGLTPMSIGFFIAKAFSALGKTRVLLFSAIFSVSANAVFDYIFAHYWQGFGIALATSAVYTCTTLILLFILRRKIGQLDLFTPPIEMMSMINKIRNSYELPRQALRIGITLSVFTCGVVGIILNATYTLRVSVGSIIMLAFLRYRYTLLMTWVLIDVFIGTTLPVFNGNNFDTGLTVPTLLLMAFTPLRQILKRMPALAFMLAFLLWVLVSIGFSAIGVGAFLTEWIVRLDFVAVGVLTVQLLTTRQRMMRIIDAILILSVVISLYGIYGYFTRQNGEFDDSIANLFRISSVFGSNAPTLALFLSMVIPLAIYRIFTVQGYRRIGNLIFILIYLATLVMTFTRAAFISLPISITVMCLFLPSRKMKFIVVFTTFMLAIAAILVADVNHIPLFERFFTSDIASLNNRTFLWQTIVDHFDATQLFGNGMDSSCLLLQRLQVLYFRDTTCTSPHSLYLGTLYDHGIVGLTLLMAVFIALLVNLLWGIHKAVGDHRILFAAALAAVINMIALNLVSNDIWIQDIGIYFWIIVALPFAFCWTESWQALNGDISATDRAAQMEIIQLSGHKQLTHALAGRDI